MADEEFRTRDVLCKTIIALCAENLRLRAALVECGAPIHLADQNGIDHEGIAREICRRQELALQALQE